MAAQKFKPKASSNIIEGATPVPETEVTNTPENDEASVETTVEETPVVETDTVGTPTPAETVEEKTAPTVTFDENKATKPVVKNVKVCVKTNHSCTIGGVTYHFIKGKQYNVPANVKSILLQADLLMPL